MKIFELYAHGLSVWFTHIEELKQTEIIKKRLFNEDGSVKKLHLSKDCQYFQKFPDAGKYYASLYENVTYPDGSNVTHSDGSPRLRKLATLITYSVDDMLEAFKELGITDVQTRQSENLKNESKTCPMILKLFKLLIRNLTRND